MILGGGRRLDQLGYLLAPCLIGNCDPQSEISRTELVGMIASLYKAPGYDETIAIADDSPYGLTAVIHSCSIDRALHFVQVIRAVVAVVNGGTYGSEP